MMEFIFTLTALLFLLTASGVKASQIENDMNDPKVAYYDNNNDYDTNPYSETGHPEERKMAMSIVKALETRPVAQNQKQIDDEANAEKIINEVDAEYENIAKKINELNKEKKRYKAMEKMMRRKRRLEILRNLKQFYARH